MLVLSGIGKRYGLNAVLRNIDLTVKPGQSVRVCGPNGSGKSTLLSIAAGFGLPDGGTSSRSVETSFIGHQPGLYNELTAKRNLACFDLAPSVVHSWLETLELHAHMDKKVQHLSRGTQQKLALVLQFASRTQLWIADEPFNALDVESVEKVTAGYIDHINAGGAVLWVSHGPRPALDDVSQRLELVA